MYFITHFAISLHSIAMSYDCHYYMYWPLKPIWKCNIKLYKLGEIYCKHMFNAKIDTQHNRFKHTRWSHWMFKLINIMDCLNTFAIIVKYILNILQFPCALSDLFQSWRITIKYSVIGIYIYDLYYWFVRWVTILRMIDKFTFRAYFRRYLETENSYNVAPLSNDIER